MTASLRSRWPDKLAAFVDLAHAEGRDSGDPGMRRTPGVLAARRRGRRPGPTITSPGRTRAYRTALACLAILAGHPPSDAVAWVRAHYCPNAVETAEQERFVTTFSADNMAG